MDKTVARILDANLNRTREALRVIEEAARFEADDPTLTEGLKQVRHDLTDAARRLDADALLAARDTAGDVGTHIETPSERRRDATADVLVSAFKRLGEGLRVLEEYGKTVDPDFAAAVERIRYRCYDLESQARFDRVRRERFAQVRLYVLVTESLCAGDWLTTAEQAIDGGAAAIQLREKELPDGELLARARRLRELTRRKGALLILNDRPDIARLVEADGVHVGQEDLPVAEVRRIVGPRSIIGKSTHTLEQARSAIAERADCIAVGPMFDSKTKPLGDIAGPETLKTVLAECELPTVAIGGIAPDNIPQLTAVGCRCVAVCGAVIGQKDVRAAAAAIRARLPE